MQTLIVFGCLGWLVGVFPNLAFRCDTAVDLHTAVGQSVLWPLFVLKFMLLSLISGVKALLGL